MDHRQDGEALIDLSFLHEKPAERGGFVEIREGRYATPDGTPLRFGGFNLTDWSGGSTAISTKEDAVVWADTLARYGVYLVRLHFMDLPTSRVMIDNTRYDSQHFDAGQPDREDAFISEPCRSEGRAFLPPKTVKACPGQRLLHEPSFAGAVGSSIRSIS
jgi:hypothetical protein